MDVIGSSWKDAVGFNPRYSPKYRGLKPTAWGIAMPFYHVWFSTKYRKWLLQGDVAEKAKEAVLQVAAERPISLLECETVVDHTHLLVEAGSKTELSWQLKLLKGRSAYEVFRAFPELKLDAGINSLWQDSFDSRMVPPQELSLVQHYIHTQDERLAKYER